MPSSLLTGVSGLLAHQRLLDLVGNNIANVNTTGFKAQRALFSDLIYQTMRPASSANEGDLGGTNPNQIGGGVQMTQTDRRFSQGTLESTGDQFDLALTGGGFFVVTDGQSDFYTRAGMFTLDEQGVLVAPGGLRVKRFPGPGEPDGVNPGFQVPGDANLRVPIGATVPGTMTQTASVTGNLSATLTPALAELMVSSNPMEVAGAPVTGATLLNDMDSIQTDYSAGDGVLIEGKDADGTFVSQRFAVSPATTVQDLLTAINGQFSGFVASLDATGNMVLTANATGPADFNVTLRDDPATPGNGETLWAMHQPVVATEGKNADSFPATVKVYDERGGDHEISLTFTKQDDDTWQLAASIDPSEGTVLDGAVDNIIFNDDGTLRSTGDTGLTFQFSGISAPQTIQLSFSNPTSLETLTHFASPSDITPAADGSSPGTLVAVNVEKDGMVRGIGSNGSKYTIAQIAIASFQNPKGLSAIGDSLFQATLNSGDPEVGLAASGSRGEVSGGQLESSNVDIAFEFTRLIVAQRGFSANARTITVSDQILEELTNIVR